MLLNNYNRKLNWYLKKHGPLKLIRLAVIRFWKNYIDNRDVMFYLDLEAENCDEKNLEKEMSVVSYKNMNNIPQKELSQLVKIKGKEIVYPYFESFFRRGAVLWLGMINETVVGYKWTVNGGFKGFNTFPMTAKDSILMAAEVLPPFRGKNIDSRITKVICVELKKIGITRIYWAVSIWNNSELKSSVKTNAKRIGIVRTYSFWGRYISIWNKKSIWQSKM